MEADLFLQTDVGTFATGAPQTPTRRSPGDGPGDGLDETSESKKKKTAKVIVTNPSLDLENYIVNYSGRTKTERLLLIGDRCPPLAIDALTAALSDLRETLDFNKYVAVHAKLNAALQLAGKPEVPLDHAWVENAKRVYKEKLDKLERELKDYKTNLIKESIRMGYNDLGDHYYAGGDLLNALKSYQRTKDYCTFPKHLLDMNLSVAEVNLELGNFPHVMTYIIKSENSIEAADNKIIVSAKLKCISGLVNLDSRKFKQAAKDFLDVDFALGPHFSKVISSNDIATYGGLCALATFDRSELKKKVIDNANFRQYLELEPQIRELLHGFYQSKYALCLKLMSELKNNLYLDLWFNGHVDEIYRDIRRRAQVQYFRPFESVDLNKMAAAFDTPVAALETELAALITSKDINARIDSHNKILRVRTADQRSTIFEKSLSMGTLYQTQVRHTLLRMKLVCANVLVKDPHRDRSDRGAEHRARQAPSFSGIRGSAADSATDNDDLMAVDA
ncbi:cop9 signalosome complex subunit [Geranomyces variabilis]|nr:cop9 signalosome complex subunit [Geranomyces variabilis]